MNMTKYNDDFKTLVQIHFINRMLNIDKIN